jgi:ABC-2 type transport system ATP-binding protein
MASGVLAIEGLGKSFGDLRVLDGVSFEVEPGRILGFLGRNGAGKTTTMRCIFGLVQPDAGTITWGGRPLDASRRRRFGYMPEERGLYPKMAVLAQLVHFGRLSGMGAPEAREAGLAWLERFGLADRAASRLEELSHGNQQRVQLAVALVHAPEVLVLDEPFSGLDPVGVAEMGRVLRGAAAEGTTILFSSHQLDLVEGLCADVAIIDSGRVVRRGDLEEIRARSPYRRAEVTVDGRPWVPTELGGTHVEGERPHTLLPASVDVDQLLAAARAVGPVTSLRFEPPSLSDLFHEAVVASAGDPRRADSPPRERP